MLPPLLTQYIPLNNTLILTKTAISLLTEVGYWKDFDHNHYQTCLAPKSASRANSLYSFGNGGRFLRASKMCYTLLVLNSHQASVSQLHEGNGMILACGVDMDGVSSL